MATTRSRKGSMQLSIEAIIIMVIAMVLLGLVIGFIANYFGDVNRNLPKPFDAVSFGCDPNAADPIKTIPAALELKSGEQLEVKVCAYAPELASNAIVGIESCVNTASETGTDSTRKPRLLTQKQTIQRTQVGGFGTILTAADTEPLPPATYICTFTTVKTASPTGGYPTTTPADSDVVARKQITIRVQ